MNTLIGNINVEDVPAPKVEKRKAIATIGKVVLKQIANGYTQVQVPLKHRRNATDRNETTFTARFNIREEWFTPAFTERLQTGQVEQNEATQYGINVQRLTRGLFKAAGLTGALDFARLEGLQVGFTTTVKKERDSGDEREDIGGFYPPSRDTKTSSEATAASTAPVAESL